MTMYPQQVKVGTKGYYCAGSDRYPVTVVEKSKTGKYIKIRHEKSEAGPGHEYYGQQNWVITENPNGSVERAVWSAKYNRYFVQGRMTVILNDKWYRYNDPHF